MRDHPRANGIVKDGRRVFRDIFADVGEDSHRDRRDERYQRPVGEELSYPRSTVMYLRGRHRGGGHGLIKRGHDWRWDAADAAAFGNVTMTLVPLLGFDCNAISAPCSRAIQLAIERPRPAPSVRLRAFSPRKNRWKTCDSSSCRMPMPVSSTTSVGTVSRIATPTVISPPASVNFTALSRRIMISCRIKVGSPMTGASSNSSTFTSTPFC